MKQRTRPGRLRGVDTWLRAERSSGWPVDVALVDVGFGVSPTTTVELFDWVRGLRPDARVEGWELDAAALERAQAFAEPGLCFLTAPQDVGPTFDVARAFNVGRAGPREALEQLHGLLVRALRLGGVALEGSTDVDGRVAAFYVLRDDGARTALVLATDLSRAVAPRLFRDVLPRDWRRSAHAGTPVFALLEDWQRSWEAVRATLDPRAAFLRSVAELAGRWAVRAGEAEDWVWLCWAPDGGVPRPSSVR